MANARRVFLWAWAAVALLIATYMGLFFFFSEDAPANLQDMRHGASTDFPSWTRILAVPADIDGALRTVAERPPEDSYMLDEPGDVVLVTLDGTPSPFLARVLAWVDLNATTNATYDVPALGLLNVTNFTLENVGYLDNATGEWRHGNLTVELTGFTPGSGYILKADRAAEPMRFHDGRTVLTTPVHASAVSKKVFTFLDGWDELLKLVVSALFALVPIAALIFTQRPRPAPAGFDVQTVVSGIRCHECGNPTPKDASFCYRCGATRR